MQRHLPRLGPARHGVRVERGLLVEQHEALLGQLRISGKSCGFQDASNIDTRQAVHNMDEVRQAVEQTTRLAQEVVGS